MVEKKLSLIGRVVKLFDFSNPASGASDASRRPGFIGGSGRDTVAQDLAANNFFVHTKQSGSVGTETYAGYPTEEYLHELRGHNRAKIYDKMRRADAQVKMLLGAFKNPILGAVWEIEAGDPDDENSQAQANLIKHILFEDMNPITPTGAFKLAGWQKFLEHVLTAADFGHAVIEKTYRLVKNHPQFGTYHGIGGLDWISPKTIERWNLDPSGALTSISQIANGDLAKTVDIPSQYLMVFSIGAEGSNFEGISLLRALYGNWLRKNLYLKLNAIGIEKFAIPTPVVKIPAGFQGQADYGFLMEMLANYTSGEQSSMITPSNLDIVLTPSPYDPAKVDAAIDAEDKRMTKAFLANFLELMGGGSFALSEDLSDFFLAGIEHVAASICSMVNTMLIPELANLNFSAPGKLPKLKFSGISDKAGSELAVVMKDLVGAQVVVPDDTLEDSIRKRYNLPKRSIEGQRKPVAPVMGMHPSASGGGGFGGASAGGGDPNALDDQSGDGVEDASGGINDNKEALLSEPTSLVERFRARGLLEQAIKFGGPGSGPQGGSGGALAPHEQAEKGMKAAKSAMNRAINKADENPGDEKAQANMHAKVAAYNNAVAAYHGAMGAHIAGIKAEIAALKTKIGK